MEHAHDQAQDPSIYHSARGYEHDAHHLYSRGPNYEINPMGSSFNTPPFNNPPLNNPPQQSALRVIDAMRVATIATQRDILDQSKAAFISEVSNILDAMACPDDPDSIITAISSADFNVHLNAAVAAAVELMELQRSQPRQ